MDMTFLSDAAIRVIAERLDVDDLITGYTNAIEARNLSLMGAYAAAIAEKTVKEEDVGVVQS